MQELPDHAKGLLVTGTGVLLLTPDSLLVRLIGLDPWDMVFWRGLLVAIGLAGFLAAYYRGQTAARFRAIGRSGTAVAVLFAAGTLFFIYALSRTTVANTLIIVSASPLMAAVFSRIFLREAVRPRTWAAILGALAGIVILLSGSLEDASKGASGLDGDFAALGTAACMAGNFTVIRRSKALNMVPAMAFSGLISAVTILPFAWPVALQPDQLWLMLLLGLVILPISFGLMTLGPRYLPAPEVGLIMLLETVLGPYWVWLVLGEAPGTRAFIGGAVVIAVLALHSILGLRAQRAARR